MGTLSSNVGTSERSETSDKDLKITGNQIKKLTLMLASVKNSAELAFAGSALACQGGVEAVSYYMLPGKISKH